MKIVIICDNYNAGGAGKAANRIAEGYKIDGNEVIYIVGYTGVKNNSIYDFGSFTIGRKHINARINIHKKNPYFKTIFKLYFSNRIINYLKAIKPDIIHLHNIHGILPNPAILYDLNRLNIPIVWTLHDMWAFTGHCSYSIECEKYKNLGCNNSCLFPDEFPPLKKKYIYQEFNQRKLLYSKIKNLHIVTPSGWLAKEAKNSIIKHFSIDAIANGIDTTFYHPIDKKIARQALGLPIEKRLLLTGSYDINIRRKGWNYFVAALNNLRIKDLEIMTYGLDNIHDYSDISIPIHRNGYIHDEMLLRILYCAADLFVLPTIADNLPNVLVESISCGTPCVGFQTGGVPEIIRHGVTGYIAEYKNSYDLGEKINNIFSISPEKYKEMSINCRLLAQDEFDFKKQSSKYLKLFHTLSQRTCVQSEPTPV